MQRHREAGRRRDGDERRVQPRVLDLGDDDDDGGQPLGMGDDDDDGGQPLGMGVEDPKGSFQPELPQPQPQQQLEEISESLDLGRIIHIFKRFLSTNKDNYDKYITKFEEAVRINTAPQQSQDAMDKKSIELKDILIAEGYAKNIGGRRRSSTARKSSSRRGRRSSKKRATKRKPKRRQRRASRRAY